MSLLLSPSSPCQSRLRYSFSTSNAIPSLRHYDGSDECGRQPERKIPVEITFDTLNIHTQICVYTYIHIWDIFLNWILKFDMETKLKTFQIIAIQIPNNIKIHIPMKDCGLFICHSLNKYISPFDLDFMHIEQCHFNE